MARNPIVIAIAISAAAALFAGLAPAVRGAADGRSGPNSAGAPSRSNVIWVADVAGCNGETIRADVMIANPGTQVDAFVFSFSYDTTKLSYTGCLPGTLNPGWSMFGCNEPTAGQVRATGFVYPGGIPAGSSGSLVSLFFQVTCSGCADGDQSVFILSGLKDDVSGWDTGFGVFTYHCVMPTPTVIPTPATNDLVKLTSVTGCNGDTVEVDVAITNPDTPLDAFVLYVNYGADKLRYLNCSPGNLNPGWNVFGCNEATPGEIRLTGYVYPGGLAVNSDGILAKLYFQVTCPTCANHDTCPLFLSHLRDDMTGWGIQNAVFMYLCATPVPTAIPTPVTTDRIWLQNFSGCSGATVTAQVMIDNPQTPVDAFLVYLNYCPSMLTYVSCESGSLNPGWSMFGCNSPQPGEIRITGYSYPQAIAAGSSGSLVRLTFTVACPGCTDGNQCHLWLSHTRDDLTGWGIQNGDFTYACATITPTQSPSSPPTLTPSRTATPTSTLTPTVTLSATVSPTSPPTVTATRTSTPTFTPSPIYTYTPMPSRTPTTTPTAAPIPATSPAGMLMLAAILGYVVIRSNRRKSGEQRT